MHAQALVQTHTHTHTRKYTHTDRQTDTDTDTDADTHTHSQFIVKSINSIRREITGVNAQLERNTVVPLFTSGVEKNPLVF